MQMIRTMVKIGSALCAAILMAAAPAWSGVVGSRHDVSASGNPYLASLGALAEFGTCSACHIPHGAGADRLFPSAPTGIAGGFFGPLCASCHTSQGFASGTNNIWGNNSVYNADAHGLEIDTGIVGLVDLGNDYSLASTNILYRGSAESPRTPAVNEIECLSCHDVHNQQGNRPFLLVTLGTLCQECHTNRTVAAAANTGYANALGTHPSNGTVFVGDLNDASGVANNGTTGNSPFIAVPALWGPLLASNTDDATAGSTWGDAVWNSGMHLEGATLTGTGVGCVSCHNVHWDDNTAPAAVTFYLGITPDNNAGANNTFCEYCHRGSTTGSGGGYWWNPGATAFSHPNDDVGSTVIDSTTFTTLPLGQFATTSARVGSAASGLVCTSCHGVHRGDSTNTETEPNSPALLNYDDVAYDNVCDACHINFGAGWNHHPIVGSYATAGSSVGGLTCQGGDIEGFNTCHGGGTNGGAAHNRLSAIGAGLNTNYSAMCVVCHTVNPSVYTPNRAFAANGEASHYVQGNVDTAGFGARTTGAAGVIRSAGVDTGLANWDASTLPSKWGATANVLICESCHRLAAGNISSGNKPTMMLVEVAGHAPETVASTVTGAAGYTGQPYMCTGCHLVPSGTHPLANATGSVYTIVGGAGQDYTTGGFVNCESCHSPHDADTDTGSYILDAGSTGSGVTGMEVEPTIDYTTFCAVCHGGFN